MTQMDNNDLQIELSKHRLLLITSNKKVEELEKKIEELEKKSDEYEKKSVELEEKNLTLSKKNDELLDERSTLVSVNADNTIFSMISQTILTVHFY